MDVGFTGTKKVGFPTLAQQNTLYKVFSALIRNGKTWLNNGDCVGSDKVAFDIFKACGGSVRGHIPTKDRHRAFCLFDEVLPAAPYLERNKTIVDYSSVLVATPDSKNEKARSGTWHTIRYARSKTNPPVTRIIVWPDGTYTIEKRT
jgi:hypothetical protein